MNSYKIIIQETVSKTFEVETHSKDDAVNKIIQKYNNCEIVLEPGDLISKELKVIDNNTDNDWIEF